MTFFLILAIIGKTVPGSKNVSAAIIFYESIFLSRVEGRGFHVEGRGYHVEGRE